MKLTEAFPSSFLKAEDVGEDGVTYTIREVKMDELGQGKDKKTKLIIDFKETKLKLVCNKTNAGIIAKIHGDDTDDWEGKKITLVAREVEFQGEIMWGIRVKSAPLSKPGAGQRSAPTPDDAPPTDVPEDDIPF